MCAPWVCTPECIYISVHMHGFFWCAYVPACMLARLCDLYLLASTHVHACAHMYTCMCMYAWVVHVYVCSWVFGGRMASLQPWWGAGWAEGSDLGVLASGHPA